MVSSDESSIDYCHDCMEAEDDDDTMFLSNESSNNASVIYWDDRVDFESSFSASSTFVNGRSLESILVHAMKETSMIRGKVLFSGEDFQI